MKDKKHNNIKVLKTLFKEYLDNIDDYYEAKEAFISDLNVVFRQHGDKDGVLCKTKYIDALNDFHELIETI